MDGPVDPLLTELFRALPPPGAKWPLEKRRVWLEIMRLTFDLLYRPQAPEEAE